MACMRSLEYRRHGAPVNELASDNGVLRRLLLVECTGVNSCIVERFIPGADMGHNTPYAH